MMTTTNYDGPITQKEFEEVFFPAYIETMTNEEMSRYLEGLTEESEELDFDQ